LCLQKLVIPLPLLVAAFVFCRGAKAELPIITVVKIDNIIMKDRRATTYFAASKNISNLRSLN